MSRLTFLQNQCSSNYDAGLESQRVVPKLYYASGCHLNKLIPHQVDYSFSFKEIRVEYFSLATCGVHIIGRWTVSLYIESQGTIALHMKVTVGIADV